MNFVKGTCGLFSLSLPHIYIYIWIFEFDSCKPKILAYFNEKYLLLFPYELML